jgi:hypothetical protein
MSGRRRLAWALGSLLVAACGAPPEAPVAMTLGFAHQALGAEVSAVRLSLFSGVQDCTVIRLSGDGALGVYQRRFEIVAGAGQGAAEVLSIVPDTYTAAAWGYDSAGRPVAFGCQAAPLVIEEGVRASLELVLDSL